MIIKELDPNSAPDAWGKAGHKAEEQMSFYLRRAFANDDGVLVFNHLRFERDGDAAQIDHLILYRYGMVIVESKSVTTKIQVNERGEWSRWYQNRRHGMPSPVLQAERQAQFLKRLLDSHAEQLLGKLLGMQTRFGSFPIDVIVAISDTGIIEILKRVVLPEVCKADQAVSHIQARMQKRKSDASIFNLTAKEGRTISKDEMYAIQIFLLKHHRPLPPFVPHVKAETQVILPPAVKPIAPPSPKVAESKVVYGAKSRYVCRDCGGDNLRVAYGKSYYFNCSNCNGNTPIRNVCPTCSSLERTRKSGPEFFRECHQCGTSELFWTNKA